MLNPTERRRPVGVAAHVREHVKRRQPFTCSSATSAGEDVSLSVGIPTDGTQLDGGMGEAIDRFYPLFDDRPAI